jgi:hypothetical protein
MPKHRVIFLIAGLSLCGAGGAYAQPQTAEAQLPGDIITDTALLAPDIGAWEFRTGFDSSRGDYGVQPPTTTSFAPVGVTYYNGAWSLSVDSGYLRVKGPVSYVDITCQSDDELFRGDFDLAALTPGVRSAASIADTVIGVKYAFVADVARGIYVDVGGRLRAPTASRAKGLGTGHVGGDLQLDVTKLLGPWLAFGSVEYGLRDKRDADRNPFALTVGGGRALTEKLSAGAFYHWRQSVVHGGGAAQEVFAYASYNLSARFFVTLYGAAGLSTAGADRQLGVRTVYRWE